MTRRLFVAGIITPDRVKVAAETSEGSRVIVQMWPEQNRVETVTHLFEMLAEEVVTLR